MRASRSGWTLLEVMVVVAVIAMLAAIATPSVIGMMRDRRALRETQALLGILQNAQSRAQGRGSAVMVTFEAGNGTTRDSIKVQDSLRSVDGQDTPSPFCGGTLSATVAFWTPEKADSTTDVTMIDGHTNLLIPDGATSSVCFSPRRGAMIIDNGTWIPMPDAAEFQVSRPNSSATRSVWLLPDGTARM